jgi:hypothetical protein
MKLSDLFVSYNQVDAVDFNSPEDGVVDPIYVNLERAKAALSGNLNQSVAVPGATPEIKVDRLGVPEMYSWVVASEKGHSGDVSDATRNWSVRTIPMTEPADATSIAELRKGSGKYASIASLRQSPHYKVFKQELDKFISQNPEYSDIKEHLDYLAALESTYEQKVPNKGGSSALGWFQFLDSTRTGLGNTQSREDFAKDAQSQLKLAASYYRSLQNQVRRWGGDPTDFVTMYGAWWQPAAAKEFISNPTYDLTTKYGESFSAVHQKAIDLLA